MHHTNAHDGAESSGYYYYYATVTRDANNVRYLDAADTFETALLYSGSDARAAALYRSIVALHQHRAY